MSPVPLDGDGRLRLRFAGAGRECMVEDQRQGAVTVANTVAKPLDKARPHADSCGMSVQRTDRDGWSWTMCPLLRI